jgi:hypothetical protein
MLDAQAVTDFMRPLREAVNADTGKKNNEDMSYRHEPFGWARVMLEEGEIPRA